VTLPTADGGKLTTIAIIKRCMGKLKSCANFLKGDSQCYSLRLDGFETKHEVFEERISALEVDLQKEVERLRDEVKTLREELKELRNEISRKRRTYVVEGIEEIEEEALKSKRRRVEIQEHDNGVSIMFG
jgi:hypothetical protein